MIKTKTKQHKHTAAFSIIGGLCLLGAAACAELANQSTHHSIEWDASNLSAFLEPIALNAIPSTVQYIHFYQHDGLALTPTLDKKACNMPALFIPVRIQGEFSLEIEKASGNDRRVQLHAEPVFFEKNKDEKLDWILFNALSAAQKSCSSVA